MSQVHEISKISGAPSDKTQKTIVGAFIAIRSANKAIKLQTNFPKITIPGLTEMNNSLGKAQAHADLWAEHLSQMVQNQLQVVIDYNSLYSPLASSINGAISDIKAATKANPPNAETMTNLAAEIEALQSQIQGILYGAGGTKEDPEKDSIMDAYSQMVNYQKNVANDAATFKGYNSVAYSSKKGISAQIKQFNADILADQQAMAKDRAMIGGGAGMIALGALVCVVAVALAPETGGATTLAIGAVGVGLISGGSYMIGSSKSDLDKKETEVANKLVSIANDNAELANLTCILKGTLDIEQHAASIYNSMNTLLTGWQQMDNEMSDIITALNAPEAQLMNWIKKEGHSDQPTYFIMGTILEAQFVAPQKDWMKASATASKFLNGLMTRIVEITLPPGTIPTSEVIAAHANA